MSETAIVAAFGATQLMMPGGEDGLKAAAGGRDAGARADVDAAPV